MLVSVTVKHSAVSSKQPFTALQRASFSQVTGYSNSLTKGHPLGANKRLMGSTHEAKANKGPVPWERLRSLEAYNKKL